MRSTRLGVTAALLVVVAAPLRAGDAAIVNDEGRTVHRFTLAQAVERARQSSARLAQLRSLADAADAGVRGARAGRLPQVDLSASYSRNSNVPELIIAFPGQAPRTIFPNIPDNYRTRVGLSQPLYTGGRVQSGIVAAESQRLAAGRDMDAGAEDLVLEAGTAYWSLVAARESARVLGEAVASFEAHLKDARNRFDFGMAARNEVLLIQVERDRAELARLQAANAAEVANVNLLRLLDLPPDARVEPTESVAVPPLPPEDVEALVAAAIEKRPEIAALRSRATAAEASARVARSATLPQAALSASFDYANPNSRILPLTAEWNSTWAVGVSVSVTAFDGGRTSAAVAQAQAQAEALRHQLHDLERRVRLDVTARFLELATARSAIEVAERNQEAAEENLRVSRDRSKEGLISSSDLLDAETARLRAGLDRTQAATQVRLAMVSLDRAAGR